jgi:hypothetical protein
MSPSFRRSVLVCAATMSLGAAASGASAQTAPDPQVIAPAADAASPFEAAPMDEAALATVSGREDRPTWQASNAQSNATVQGNKIGDNSPTGALAVSDAAFQNVSGISMVNLNTGNASSINASMNVNLSIQMAPPALGGR